MGDRVTIRGVRMGVIRDSNINGVNFSGEWKLVGQDEKGNFIYEKVR